MIFNPNTDATLLYRETSAVKTVRMDRTADTGSLMEIIRDAVVITGSATPFDQGARIPVGPEGTMDAYSRV